MPLNKKILIVDDDVDFSEAMSSFLESHGFQVFRASDGGEGVKLAKAERPDLILMDVVMRERTEGFFTVQEIRHTPGLEKTPIFVLTSLYSVVPGFRVNPEASWLAHDAFFAKPVDLTELLEKVNQTLGLAASKEVAS
jgi:DNA-binding response OmpR family regulator